MEVRGLPEGERRNEGGAGAYRRADDRVSRVSRASFYRFEEDAESGSDADMDLRDSIQRVALQWPSYGRRRITQELRRRGWVVNWKRVCRLMREDNLLCVRKRKFLVTTDSNHGRRIWPNLAGNLVLTDVDQLWRADITYIRLREDTSDCARNSFFWLSFWMHTHAESSAGHWTERWKMNSR